MVGTMSIDMTFESSTTGGGLRRLLDQERRPHDLLHVPLGERPLGLAGDERVAVVRGHDDHRIVEPALVLEPVEHVPEEAVRRLELEDVPLVPERDPGIGPPQAERARGARGDSPVAVSVVGDDPGRVRQQDVVEPELRPVGIARGLRRLPLPGLGVPAGLERAGQVELARVVAARRPADPAVDRVTEQRRQPARRGVGADLARAQAGDLLLDVHLVRATEQREEVLVVVGAEPAVVGALGAETAGEDGGHGLVGERRDRRVVAVPARRGGQPGEVGEQLGVDPARPVEQRDRGQRVEEQHDHVGRIVAEIGGDLAAPRRRRAPARHPSPGPTSAT